jgi:hypothetical protein
MPIALNYTTLQVSLQSRQRDMDGQYAVFGAFWPRSTQRGKSRFPRGSSGHHTEMRYSGDVALSLLEPARSSKPFQKPDKRKGGRMQTFYTLYLSFIIAAPIFGLLIDWLGWCE